MNYEAREVRASNFFSCQISISIRVSAKAEDKFGHILLCSARIVGLFLREQLRLTFVGSLWYEC